MIVVAFGENLGMGLGRGKRCLQSYLYHFIPLTKINISETKITKRCTFLLFQCPKFLKRVSYSIVTASF